MSILKNRLEEKSSEWLYQKMAEHELDPVRRGLFLELAEAAGKQAKIWETKWIEQGGHADFPPFRPTLRTWIVGKLITLFGTNQLRFILSAMKVRGMSVYSGVPTSHPAASHLEQRHKGIGHAGSIRAAVFGVNDGLVSNISLLAGIAGASVNHSTLILTGVAGLLAGACSMASGEYVSVRSQREFFEYQIALEEEELKLYPEEEASELACIYRARGMPATSAQQLADLIISDPQRALDVLAQEELGLNPAELSSPIAAAIASFLSFAVGAFVPLLPFLFIHQATALFFSLGLTGVALFLIGSTLSLFTNQSAWYGGLRMLFIGSLAAGVTYFIGTLFNTM